MSYQILLSEKALEALKSFDAIVQGMIISWLEKHIASHEDPKSIGENFGGEETIWRYRIGKYRVLCLISEDDQTVTILAIQRGYQSRSYAIPPMKQQVHEEILYNR